MPNSTPRKSRRVHPAQRRIKGKKKSQGAVTALMPAPLAAIFNNPTAAAKEMLVTLTDFFESPGSVVSPYQQYQLSLSNVLGFDAGTTGVNKPLARITKFELFALPRSQNANVAGSLLAVLFGLPVSVGGPTTANSTAASKTTVLTPTSVSDWVLVGTWNEHTISSTAQSILTTESGLAVLGTFAVFNPDDWTPVADAIQYMARITVAQALPSYFNVAGAVPNSLNENAFIQPEASVVGTLGLMAEATAIHKVE